MGQVPELCASLDFFPGAFLAKFPTFFNYTLYMLPLPAFLPELRYYVFVWSVGNNGFPFGEAVEPDS